MEWRRRDTSRRVAGKAGGIVRPQTIAYVSHTKRLSLGSSKSHKSPRSDSARLPAEYQLRRTTSAIFDGTYQKHDTEERHSTSCWYRNDITSDDATRGTDPVTSSRTRPYIVHPPRTAPSPHVSSHRPDEPQSLLRLDAHSTYRPSSSSSAYRSSCHAFHLHLSIRYYSFEAVCDPSTIQIKFDRPTRYAFR